MDKLIDALRETLAELGLDADAIEAAVQKTIEKASQTEENPELTGDPVPSVGEGEVPLVPPTDVLPDDGSEVPSADLPPVEGDVPPVEGEVPPQAEGQPSEPPVPAVPPFDPTELIAKVDELQGQLGEQIKANEGLVARIQALEEALKTAGVIDGSEPTVTEVGDPLPSAAPQNPTDDVLGGVIAKLNSGKKF